MPIKRLWPLLLASTLYLSHAEAAFRHNFDDVDITSISTFTLTSNGLSAIFTGGTAFEVISGPSLPRGTTAWLLDPKGILTRGPSTGEGVITFNSEPMTISFNIRHEVHASAKVLILDVNDNVLLEQDSKPNTWTSVSINRIAGQAPIGKVKFSNTTQVGTTGLAVLDDLAFSTQAFEQARNSGSDDDGGGGSINLVFLIFLAGLMRVACVMQRRKIANQGTNTNTASPERALPLR